MSLPLETNQNKYQKTSKPTSTLELDPSEIFIVWSFRRWATGLRQNNGVHWKLIWNEFSRQFGTRNSSKALTEFVTIMRMIQAHARRPMRHHQPCCPCLAADEVMLICLIAACQTPQGHMARRLASWMVKPDGIDSLLKAGGNLSTQMAEHAMILPVRTQAIDAADAADAAEAADAADKDASPLHQIAATVH
ncbi:MAG: hypothetical protein JKY20_13365 [Alphaproteobacteria bacterium]|nr:hypothetical protein [Alphaproteobacteria bacterium]